MHWAYDPEILGISLREAETQVHECLAHSCPQLPCACSSVDCKQISILQQEDEQITVALYNREPLDSNIDYLGDTTTRMNFQNMASERSQP
jgi:hypothetical protein